MSSTQPDLSLPYWNAELPIADRVTDLLGRMTIAEKAGMLFQTMLPVGAGGTLTDAVEAFGIPATTTMVIDLHITHFNMLGAADSSREIAQWHNRVQRLARETRLGIPVTMSSDPRNHFTDNPGTAAFAGPFSQWPETLGLAAIRSADLVRTFADTARQEYLAVGLRVSLHPQIDLATEPRWARISATFGEDADLTSELVAAYIRGFQGDELGTTSVATMVKHFPGGGPQKDGEDPHFPYGREQVYPGGQFEYHLKPFIAAIAAGASQMMPYYGMPVGTEYEEVGFGLNKSILTGLLREKLGFTGIICTDWGLVTDSFAAGQEMPARAWGAEDLSEIERVEKILNAGADQFGGETRTDLVLDLVAQGRITEERIDVSVARLLAEKFTLGLFENPFVDEDAAERIVGNPEFRAAGEKAQRDAFTLLTNDGTLPLQPGLRVYVEGIDADAVAAYATVVDTPHEANVALLRLRAPFEPRPGGFEAFFHAGSLAFEQQELDRLAAIFAEVPTVVDIYLDRPAVLGTVATDSSAVLVDFGSNDLAFLDIVFGRSTPLGKLPFDLPSSMASVENSKSDVPFDTANPLFRFGHGLTY